MTAKSTASHTPKKTDLPVGSDYKEGREPRPGKPLVDKAPPEACAIRPFAVKFRGQPPVEGELQGTLEHCRVIASKYHRTFGDLIEWVQVEGEPVI